MTACGSNASGDNLPELTSTEASQEVTSELSTIEEQESTEEIENPAEENPAGRKSTAESETESETDESETEVTLGETDSVEGKTLVVYFSRTGNTKTMAEYIAEQTGGTLLEINASDPYPEDYDACVDRAETEKDENARPEISNLPESISEYENIIIGYPIWWHTAPMIIGTFLENYDLTGVNIYPFSQSGTMKTEQFEESMEFIRNSAANGNVYEGLFTESTEQTNILTYLESNNLVQ